MHTKDKQKKQREQPKTMEGKKAPMFTLPDQDGRTHTLKEYLGKKVLLYFYPKDMTSGCTVEAEGFRDIYADLKKEGVAVFGISKDSILRHKAFCEKYELPFTLLSDESTKIIQKYGVWVEKSMYGKKYMGIQRDSFLIDEEGRIEKHYVKVKPADHPTQVLNDLRS